MLTTEQALAVASVANAISGSIAGSIGASVGAAMGASVGSSAGASVGASSGGGATALIGVVQTLSFKGSIQTGKSSPMFSGLTNKMSWATLDIRPPVLGDASSSGRRKLLDETDANNPAETAWNRLFWIGTVILPVQVIHSAIAMTSDFFQGPIGFPSLELTTLNMLLLPFLDIGAKLLALEEPRFVGLAVVLMIIFPIPYLIYSCCFIHKNVIGGKLVYGQEVKAAGSTKAKPPRWFIMEPSKGSFFAAHTNLFITGNGGSFKPVQLEPVFKLNPDTNKFVRYRVVADGHVNAGRGRTMMAAFYPAAHMLKNGIATLLLGIWGKKMRSAAAPGQLYGLVSLGLLNLVFVQSLSPFSDSRAWFLETFHTVMDIATYSQGIAMIYADAPELLSRLDQGMLGCQIAGIAGSIIIQFIGMGQLAFGKWQEWRRRKGVRMLMDVIMNDFRSRIWAKKYANRWMYRALGRPLQGWCIPDGVKTNKTNIEVNIVSVQIS